jgi:hypothetical protein
MRELASKSIDELESLFSQAGSDRIKLRELNDELDHRTAKRARALRTQVELALMAARDRGDGARVASKAPSAPAGDLFGAETRMEVREALTLIPPAGMNSPEKNAASAPNAPRTSARLPGAQLTVAESCKLLGVEPHMPWADIEAARRKKVDALAPIEGGVDFDAVAEACARLNDAYAALWQARFPNSTLPPAR